MLESHTIFVVFTFLGALLLPEIKATVVFYEESDFKGYMIELPLKSECTNLPAYAYRRAKSMKTSDCVIVYNSLNCNNNGVSYKLAPGDHKNLSSISHQGLYYTDYFHNAIYSFRKCSESIGGSKTHITLYTRRGIEFEIENLCETVTIPSYAAYPTAFDNHGNCIVATGEFKSGQISKSSYRLKGGRSMFSLRTNANTHSARFDSIEPCEPSPSCIVLNATVTGFEIIDHGLGIQARIPIGTNKTFINDGFATMSEEYSAQQLVTEATEISYVERVSKINNWNVKPLCSYTFPAKDVLSAVANQIKDLLSNVYTRDASKSTQTMKIDRHEVSKQFSVKQNIEIQPCTKYKVGSFIEMAKRNPMKYAVTFEVIGFRGSSRLSSSYISKILGSEDHKGEKNEYTVIYSDKADLFLDFGVESFVEGKGEIIEECLNNKKEFDKTEDGKNCAENGQSSGENEQSAAANGLVTAVNGLAKAVDGLTTAANGQTTAPGGQITDATGQYTEANGQTTEANGQTTEANGQTTEANGQTTEANGQTTDDTGHTSA